MAAYGAVIFDFGGVLTAPPGHNMRAYCDSTGVPWERFRELFMPLDGAWSRYETSALSRKEFVPAFEAEAAAQGITIDGASFLSAFFSGLDLRPDMVAVVHALRPHLRVGCITNNVRTDNPARQALFSELFEVVVESSKVGMRKPDPAIYRLACDLLGVAPPEAIFLDDFGVNLKAARTLGMATIKVDESQTAIAELERLLGLTLPRGQGVGTPE